MFRSKAAIITTVLFTLFSPSFTFSTRPLSSKHHLRLSHSTTPKMTQSPSCPAAEARCQNLFSTTPLIHSIPLSKLCQRDVYLKLDCLQPSGSFKDRGMGHLCATVHKVYGANKQKEGSDNDGNNARMKFISSSGGNAGLAITTVAKNLPVDVSVVVPSTTKPLVIEKLKSLGAEVTIHGSVWNEADGYARQLVESIKEGGGESVYVSPYDNPLLWTGHSTVVDEIIGQLQSLREEVQIGALLASVGGGGLLCGIFEGIERNYFGNSERSNVINGVKVVACETEGAASFAASFHASKDESDLQMVRLEGINSVATSLGALEVTSAVIQRSIRHKERGDVASYVCTDVEAVDACVKFAADHRILVEPACGASLAPLYSERLRSKLLEGMGGKEKVIVVEVCGGSGVSLELLQSWKKEFLM